MIIAADYYYYYFYLIIFYNGKPFSELQLIFKGPITCRKMHKSGRKHVIRWYVGA
jgi:hypothetical protein